jgi:predicted dehydrogenase
MQPVRWGIVGTGHMAETMATELRARQSHGHELTAVVSRASERGAAFCARHGVGVNCPTIDALATLPSVDIVYIASPHTGHAEQTATCLRAGKAVLCEKPFATNASEANRVAAAWRQNSAFLMEAMWTRFLPAIDALRAELAAERIGRVQLIVGGGAFIPSQPSSHYLTDTQRAGGVLLDAGVYLVSLASLVLGRPSNALGCAAFGPTGIDEQDAMILDYPNGAKAVLYVSMRARRPPDLEIIGDAGRIRIHAPIFRPTRLTLTDASGTEQTQEYPVAGSGYGYQLDQCAAHVRRGERECPLMPVAESLSIMHTLDAMRRQIGLQYPHESRIGETR